MINIRKLSIAQQIALSFATVILIGSFLLTLPISQLSNSNATYLDNLFTTVSMVCVTGLFTVPVVSTYTLFGQIVCILLMQIGGLGLMTIVAVILISMGKKVTHANKMTLSQAINKEGLSDIKGYLKRIVMTTLIVELIGALLLMIRFIPQFGLGRGIFNSIFVAVSAFCNAGYDNFSTQSLINYVNDPLINFTISSLLIFGGLGFAVWFDLFSQIGLMIKKKRTLHHIFKHLQVHSRIVLRMTVYLLTVGTLSVLIFEFNNPQTLGNMNIFEKVMAAYFQSATMRTAGFATMDYTLFRTHSLLIYVGLMFVGGSPGSTAGGIKTTTMKLVQLFVKRELFDANHVNVHHHTVNKKLINQAVTVFVTFVFVLCGGVLLLVILNPEVNLIYLIFEAISALATVGVSANLTPDLGRLSQAVLMILMFVGRIGPLTMYLSLGKRTLRNDNQYANANILVG